MVNLGIADASLTVILDVILQFQPPGHGVCHGRINLGI